MLRTTTLRKVPAVRALLVALALGLLATACGDSDDSSSSAGETTTEDGGAEDTGEAGGYPVTIEHAFGETTIEERPERVVSLGAQWTDVLLALDVQPVGHISDDLAGDDGIFPWQEELSDDSTPIEAVDQVPLEQVASLQPDLILVTYLAVEEPVYDDLSSIAPTIGMLGERDVDHWQDLTEVAGRVFDDTERATQLTEEVEQQVADTATELPGLAGKTFAMVNFVPGEALYIVADPEDGSSIFFQQLGMELDPTVLEERDPDTARVELSLERVDLLGSDMLVIFSNDGDPGDLVGYDQLPAVVNDTVAELGYEDVVALNTPSPLSIPYALDLLGPTLEALAES